MIKEEIYSKLTNSAKEAFEEMSEDFKASLLEKAYSIAKERNTADREISLRDLLEAKQPLEDQSERISYQDNKRKRWTMLVLFSGTIYAVAGLIIYLFQNNKFSIETDLGLIVAVVGILLSLVAFSYGQINSKRYLPPNSYSRSAGIVVDDYELVKKWQVIESLARKIMTDSEMHDDNSGSVSFLIRFLSHRVARDKDEFLKIRELLSLRNKIVHERYTLRNSERKEFIDFADDLIDRLEIERQESNKDQTKLKIIKASYYTQRKTLDAKKALIDLIKNNRLEFIANNELVGDPDPGTPKQLSLTIEIEGGEQTYIFSEGDKVIIDGTTANKR